MRRMTEQEFRAYSLSGNLYRLIIQVGTPLAVFALFNTLFSILDTMMASHLGTIEVSTVAYMNQLRMVLNATGLITGSMILINREYGAGNNEKTSVLMNTLIRLILIISLIFLMMFPFIPWLLKLISTPDEFSENGFSDASSSIISQNYGAGKYKRAIKAYKANFAITMVASIIAISFLFLINDFLLDIFATSRTGYDASFKENIRKIFIYDSIGCLGIALNGAGMDFLLGLGKTKSHSCLIL